MSDLRIQPLARPFALVITPPGSKSLTNRSLVLAALADGITADRLVADIMRAVPAPEKVLETRVAANA